MKNRIKPFIVLIVILNSVNLVAQNFQGKAFYQTKTAIDLDFSDAKIPAERIQRIKDRMKDRFEKTFVLTFNKTASIYKEEVKLDNRMNQRGGFRFMMGGTSGKYYKNTQTLQYAKEREFMGKNFLIKDSLKKFKWKLEQDTKMIGNNLCFKATALVYMPTARNSIRFGDKRPEEPEKNTKSKNEPKLVTAWYTLDIPVSNGPDDYWGLPGLILEIGYQNTNILCTKIVMNPSETIAISEPKKGKKVTQKEFSKIVIQKTKEMKERFKNEREKGGNHPRFRMH